MGNTGQETKIAQLPRNLPIANTLMRQLPSNKYDQWRVFPSLVNDCNFTRVPRCHTRQILSSWISTWTQGCNTWIKGTLAKPNHPGYW